MVVGKPSPSMPPPRTLAAVHEPPEHEDAVQWAWNQMVRVRSACPNDTSVAVLEPGQRGRELPNFKVLELQLLKDALIKKDLLMADLLNASIWYECERQSQTIPGFRAVLLDTYSMSDPDDGSYTFYAPALSKMDALVDWVAAERDRTGLIILPIFASGHYIASAAQFTSNIEPKGGRNLLSAAFMMADSMARGPYGPTLDKAVVAQQLMASRFVDKVAGAWHVKPDCLNQQNDSVVDSAAKNPILWSCGLHTVANSLCMLRDLTWSEQVPRNSCSKDEAEGYRRIRLKHWRMTMEQAGKFCALVLGGIISEDIVG